MSVSTRRDRGMVYVYSASSQSGYLSEHFDLQGTYFCRFSPQSAGERTVGAQAQHSEKAVFEFASGVSIGMNDIIIRDDVQWRVEGVMERRKFFNHQRIVRAFRVDDDVYLQLLRFDGAVNFDGTVQFAGYVSAIQEA